MTGKELCDLTREQFETRTPGYYGDILHAHLANMQEQDEQTVEEPVNFSIHSLQTPQQQHQPPADPYYGDHYTPPAHIYPNFSAHQQHQHLYAGEQYHGYGFQQPMVSIPPPPMPIYRQMPVSIRSQLT